MIRSFIGTYMKKKDKLEPQNRNILHRGYCKLESRDIQNFFSQLTKNKRKKEKKSNENSLTIEAKIKIRECVDNVKLGVKTGALIGFVFGGINGTYHAIKYKSYISIPISTIGGAISFGFFLGCGMLVRCQDSDEFKYYSFKINKNNIEENHIEQHP
ncbi:hypothetical protein FG386_002612 [Cryptosporidium ryanae]|uniref:uncharacterized protein n=1 Tax=Cryptosporidium ryanae TaxID=515981 RepID=UPI00351AA3B1|nr:hypothetical protein FG386_002612 [Cryptosporidium ryanae]